jgi:hypothetical protein
VALLHELQGHRFVRYTNNAIGVAQAEELRLPGTFERTTQAEDLRLPGTFERTTQAEDLRLHSTSFRMRFMEEHLPNTLQ